MVGEKKSALPIDLFILRFIYNYSNMFKGVNMHWRINKVHRITH